MNNSLAKAVLLLLVASQIVMTSSRCSAAQWHHMFPFFTFLFERNGFLGNRAVLSSFKLKRKIIALLVTTEIRK